MGSEEMIYSWDSQNYFDWAKKMVELYRNISAFVGDGLPAGISGIAHFHTDGYLALTQGTRQIFSPCYSHILNLSFKKSAESCNIISETIDQIDFLIMVLNKPFVKEQTKKRFPMIPKTRWLYCFDVCHVILRDKALINNTLTSNKSAKLNALLRKGRGRIFLKGIPEHFTDFQLSLEPLKKLQLALEKDSTVMSLVFLYGNTQIIFTHQI